MKNQKLRKALLIMSVILLMASWGCDKIDYYMPVKGQGDVFVAGSETNGTDTSATYWKNGTAVHLTDGKLNGYLTGITVSNNGVYALGYEGSTLKYWRNGTAVSLGDTLVHAGSLCVSNNDVYILATLQNNFTNPVIIKNNKASFVVFQNHSSKTFEDCLAMAVNGNDVYLAGDQNGGHMTPMLWKNGIPILTTTKQG